MKYPYREVARMKKLICDNNMKLTNNSKILRRDSQQESAIRIRCLLC